MTGTASPFGASITVSRWEIFKTSLGMPLGDNGHHLKEVPTTDEKHIPKDDRELRRLTRAREGYVNDMTREKNKIHHALESCGIKLSSVLADVFGKSGLDLLNSLLAGVGIEEIIEGIPMKRIRKKADQLREAVKGSLGTTQIVLIRGGLKKWNRSNAESMNWKETLMTKCHPCG